MPLYEFKCRKCGLITTTTRYGVVPECDVCGAETRKQFSFFIEKPFVPHFNPSVGRYVASEHDFNEALKAASDAESARTGIDHNYVRVDNADRDAFGATDEGMDSYYEFNNNAAHETLLP